jgi:NADH:ubiquinone oxidoreductase subunit 3 (subunit A)
LVKTKTSIFLDFEFDSRQLSLMGDFEFFFIIFSTLVLSFVIYNLLNSFMFRNLIRRFGLLKQTRKDFYECGFRPVTQKPICLPIPFLLICVFFLLYDIELIYLFPLVSTEEYIGLYETALLFFFFIILFIGLMFDFTRHVLYWQY